MIDRSPECRTHLSCRSLLKLELIVSASTSGPPSYPALGAILFLFKSANLSVLIKVTRGSIDRRCPFCIAKIHEERLQTIAAFRRADGKIDSAMPYCRVVQRPTGLRGDMSEEEL